MLPLHQKLAIIMAKQVQKPVYYKPTAPIQLRLKAQFTDPLLRRECDICLEDKYVNEFVCSPTCGHLVCKDCRPNITELTDHFMGFEARCHMCREEVYQYLPLAGVDKHGFFILYELVDTPLAEKKSKAIRKKISRCGLGIVATIFN